MKFEKDLSSGSVVLNLIKFSIPFLISNLFQTLYNVADMIIVGNSAGPISMSGVNIGSQATFIITNAVFGLCVGATVLIAQYFTSGDRKAMKETIGTLFSTLILLSVVLTVIMYFLNEPILRLIKTPTESFSEASIYFRITMLGNIFIFAYNAISAVMRGMGDSKNPLIFVAIACVINVFGDLLLVPRMGAAGAALATVASQALSVVLCIIFLKKNKFIFDFSLQSFRFNRERFAMLIKIGVPTSVQNIATGVSFMFITAMVNTVGPIASAAVGAVAKLNGFAILPAAAMSAAVSAMSAQNIGVGYTDRAKKTMWTGALFALSISIVIFTVMRLFGKQLLMVFNDDPQLIEYGVEYISSFAYDYLMVPFLFCLNGLFIGAGHTGFSLFNSALSALLIRIPASYIIGSVLNLGLEGIGAGAPVATGIALIVAFIYFFSGYWKKPRIIKNK